MNIFIGSKNSNVNFFAKTLVKMKALYKSLDQNVEVRKIKELKTLFQQIKTSTTEDVTLTLPNTKDTFFVTVESSLIGLGCVLFQRKDKKKRDSLK